MDSQSLQFELSYAMNKSGVVDVSGRRVWVDTTVTIPSGVLLRGSPNTVFTSDKDIDMVYVMPNCQIQGNGMTIENTNPDCTKAKLKLDTSVSPFANYKFNGARTRISSVRLKGAVMEQASGIGLHLRAAGEDRAIRSCVFRDMVYQDLGTSIFEEVIGDGTTTYINGNIHDGIVIDDCRSGLVQSVNGRGTVGANSNQYKGLNVQAGTGMDSVIELVGKANYVQGRIFDFYVASGDYAVIASGERNVFLLPESNLSEYNVHPTSIFLVTPQ